MILDGHDVLRDPPQLFTINVSRGVVLQRCANSDGQGSVIEVDIRCDNIGFRGSTLDRVVDRDEHIAKHEGLHNIVVRAKAHRLNRRFYQVVSRQVV